MIPASEQELREQVAKIVISKFYSGSAEYTAEQIADALLPLFRVREAETELVQHETDCPFCAENPDCRYAVTLRAALAAAKEAVHE